MTRRTNGMEGKSRDMLRVNSFLKQAKVANANCLNSKIAKVVELERVIPRIERPTRFKIITPREIL